MDAAAPPAPIARASQQVTSNLAARLASGALIGCLAAGPLALGVAGFAMTQSARPVTSRGSTAVDLSDERAGAGEFATRVVMAWLTSTREQAQGLIALLPGMQAGALPRVGFGASDPAVSSITQTDGVWSVTVAVTVTDQRPSTARRFFRVPVTVTGGTITALTLPTPVAGPPVGSVTNVDYPAPVASGPVAVTVAQFLAAYTAGAGDVTRYVTPGVAMTAISPAPYTTVQLTDVRADLPTDTSAAAPDGTVLRVLATVAATVTDTQTTSVTYALTLTARAGRWEVHAIDPAPAYKPTAPAIPSGPATTATGTPATR